jgi:hypothetical protein
MREVKRRVKIVRGVTALGATGGDCIEAVAYRAGGEGEVRLAAETLLLHQGVAPDLNLASPAPSAGEANHPRGARRAAADRCRREGGDTRLTRTMARPDVIVIGGGLHGCLAALHLYIVTGFGGGRGQATSGAADDSYEVK